MDKIGEDIEDLSKMAENGGFLEEIHQRNWKEGILQLDLY